MKKFTILLSTISFLLIIGCDVTDNDRPVSDMYGTWTLTKMSSMGASEEYTNDVFIYVISEDQIIEYDNKVSAYIEPDTISYTWDDDKMVTEEGITIEPSFSGDDLILNSTMNLFGAEIKTNETYKKYDGDLPPSGW